MASVQPGRKPEVLKLIPTAAVASSYNYKYDHLKRLFRVKFGDKSDKLSIGFDII